MIDIGEKARKYMDSPEYVYNRLSYEEKYWNDVYDAKFDARMTLKGVNDVPIGIELKIVLTGKNERIMTIVSVLDIQQRSFTQFFSHIMEDQRTKLKEELIRLALQEV